MVKSKSASRPIDLSHIFSLLSLIVLIFIVAAEAITPFIATVAVAFLGVAVLTAVHHAEVVAERVGPSLGALILAVAVTVIEVGLIVSLMMNNTADSAFIARDTVFSAVIIVTNGIVGFCLLVGGVRFREQDFHVEGTGSLLAVLAVLVGLALILPNYTTSIPGPVYTTAQLAFVSVASIVLYVSLVVAQTLTHKDYFEVRAETTDSAIEHSIPSRKAATISFAALILSLLAVIGLAKMLSPTIESVVNTMGAPRAVVGIVIALLVLLPEAWAAISSARANQLQTSLNLALGSGVASVALTIPVVSVFSIMTGRELGLGLDAKSTVLAFITLMVAGLTLGTGRTTALKGIVHLVILCAYLFLSFSP